MRGEVLGGELERLGGEVAGGEPHPSEGERDSKAERERERDRPACRWRPPRRRSRTVRVVHQPRRDLGDGRLGEELGLRTWDEGAADRSRTRSPNHSL